MPDTTTDPDTTIRDIECRKDTEAERAQRVECEPSIVLYQQKHHNVGHGDCLRAALATMMQWNADELPNFIEDGDPWWLVYKTGLARGWGLYHETPDRAADRNESPTGWVLATVPSLAFPDSNHSLVVDAATLRLVHDPNPLKWKRNGIDRADIITCLVAVHAEALCAIPEPKESTDE